MNTANGPPLPSHRSVSQWLTASKCGEQYRLERIAKAPQTPAGWFVQGVAFHHAAEVWERSCREIPESEILAIYYAEYDRLVEAGKLKEPNLNRWMTGGRTKGSDDVPRRRARGAEQLRGYFRYVRQAKERVFLIGPDEPAVEVEFSLDLDGLEVIGFIDQLIVWPGGQVGPRDLKTGSKLPDWPFQLGIYRLAIEELFGFLPEWGDFYMAKNDLPLKPMNLARFTRERVTRWFHDLDKQIEQQLFLPNVGDGCRTCGVSDFCSAVGARAHEYPPTVRG